MAGRPDSSKQFVHRFASQNSAELYALPNGHDGVAEQDADADADE